MAVYNGEKYLKECIDSICNQTFTDFEFIIVDDCSTDCTAKILNHYALSDDRIKIITNTINQGMAYSRNNALNCVNAQLIAVMDADDWSYPDRLEKQYAFMQTHPEITVCGGFIEDYEYGRIWSVMKHNEELHIEVLFDSIFAHPTVMLRTNIMLEVKGYDVTFPYAQDYDLWQRLAEKADVKFANLPDVLIRYRVHPEIDRSIYYEKQRRGASRVRKNMLCFFMDGVTAKEIAIHDDFCTPAKGTLFQILFQFSPWAYRLYKAFVQDGYSHSIVKKILIKKIIAHFHLWFIIRCKKIYFLKMIWRLYNKVTISLKKYH